MKSKNGSERFTITVKSSSEPLTEYETDEIIDILTDMMAARYVAEHPEQFEREHNRGDLGEECQDQDEIGGAAPLALTQSEGSIIMKEQQRGEWDE